jgi:hypothetical protein
MKLTKALLLCAATVTLASCGNPHLIATESSDNNTMGTQTQVADSSQNSDSVLTGKNIKDDSSKLEFGKLPSNYDISRKVIINNPSNSDITINLNIVEGSHFVFNGGSAPGTNGTCSAIIKAQESCSVDIRFITNEIGFFEDSLKITDSFGHVLIIPLSGERTSNNVTKKQNRLLIQNSILNELDFGQVIAGSSSTKTLDIINPTDSDIKVTSIDLSNKTLFKITDSKKCIGVIKPGTCQIQVTYSPLTSSNASKDTSLVTINYADNKILEQKVKGESISPVVVEHIVDNACHSIKEVKVKAENKLNVVVDSKDFPYFFKAKNSTAKLNLLYGTETNARVTNTEIKTVLDSEVLSVFNIENKIQGKISDIQLTIDVQKMVSKANNDTEMICLSTDKLKRCSGHFFQLIEWRKLINNEYFKPKNGVANMLYEENLHDSTRRCGSETCEFIQATYSVRTLFGLTAEELNEIKSEKNIKIILADDTRNLSMPTLNFIVKDNSACNKSIEN